MTLLTIPEAALHRVLSAWSGGLSQLVNALTTVEPEHEEQGAWSSAYVRRRALLVVLLALEPALAKWPTSYRIWDDLLPVSSSRHRFWSERPQSKVNWVGTLARGWPPEQFAITRRSRHLDDRALGILAWTLNALNEASSGSAELLDIDAANLRARLGTEAEARLAVALELLGMFEDVEGETPSTDDLAALRSEGWPWSAVAEVAQLLAKVERGGGASFAARLLAPMPEFRDRLFQLGILGTVLDAIDGQGGSSRSLGPIASAFRGPVYEVFDALGRRWDLWFEASSCWDDYRTNYVYKPIASGLRNLPGAPFSPRPLRVDVLLARFPEHAISIECKFPTESPEPSYLAQGVSQAEFYGRLLKTTFKRVEAYVAGPTELVGAATARRLSGLRLGIADSSGIAERVRLALMQP